MLSISWVGAPAGINPSIIRRELGNASIVRRIRIGQEASRGEDSEQQNFLNAGRKSVFFMCKPPRDLAHRNKKRYLFSGRIGVFFLFLCSKKNACGHTLRPCPQAIVFNTFFVFILIM